MGQKKKTGVSPKTIKWIWYAAFAPFALVALMLVLTVFGVFGRMPSFEELENPRSNLATEIYSEDGKVIGTFFVQNRSYVQYADLYPSDSTLHIRLAGHEVPPIVAALIATEDVRFRTHSGIDIPSLARVAVKTLLLQNTSQGGGSTITQQLAKNLFPRDTVRTASFIILCSTSFPPCSVGLSDTRLLRAFDPGIIIPYPDIILKLYFIVTFVRLSQ